MELRNKAFLYGLIFLASIGGYTLDLSKVNVSYIYQPDAPLSVEYRLMRYDDLQLIMKVATDSGNWLLNVLNQEKLDSETHDTLYLEVDTLGYMASEHTIRASIPDRVSDEFLILVFINPITQSRFIFPIRVPLHRYIPTFLPTDLEGNPILRAYTKQDTIRLFSHDSVYHVFRYLEDFGPADPPMGQMRPLAPSLKIDSSFELRGTLVMEEYKFYLMQTDTLEEFAVTLLKCPNYYPKYRTIEELIGPLTYITTEAESKRINTGGNQKKSFELFWINTYGTKFRAKSAIRNFYDSIEMANQLFTDYKQGWKTDRGIIYIIFGPPDVVFKEEKGEIWRYDAGYEFEFIRLSTLFTPELYSLKRNRDYDKLWYGQVGEIRKGTINNE